MDYAAWARRASEFVRGLTHLPGEIELDDGIEAPGSDDHTQEWLRSGECSLAPELKSFVSTATRHCFFRYRWKPPHHLHGVLAELFPGREELIGGGDFCNSAGFRNYDNRAWFQDELAPFLEQAPAPTPPSLAGDDLALWSTSMSSVIDSFMKGAGVTDDDRLRGRIALLPLEGEAKIALELGLVEGTRPVVYVDPDDPKKRHIVSTSFDQFLSDWEQVCYITPHPQNLAAWLDPTNGRLNPNSSKVRLLRGIFQMADHRGKE